MLVLLAVSGVACATDSAQLGTPSNPNRDAGAVNPDVAPLPERSDVLCDGSTDVRLLMSWSGGRGVFPAFLLPFGNHFTFVDGKCRFFTGGFYGSGYRTGTLTG